MNVTLRGRTAHFRTVAFDAKKNSVRLIEQRLLPHEFTVVGTKDFRATAAAITDMVVRGAGAIGATAAYGLAQGARAFRGSDLKKFSRHVDLVFKILAAARPTAVDPVNAMRAGAVIGYRGLVREIVAALRAEVGAEARVVATGGDAQFLARSGIVTFDVVDPELTLHGLREIAGRRK